MASAAATQLTQMALKIATDARQRAKSLEQERRQMETRLRQIQVAIDAAKFSHERFRKFGTEMARNLQCPRCWVLSETKTTLTAVPSKAKDNYFTCESCGLDVRISLGPKLPD